MKKHSTRWIALLLVAIMILNTAVIAFAAVETGTAATGSGYEEVLYEDEDGRVTVTHGFAGEEPELLGGVRDEDYPIVSDFKLEESGKSYKTGDTLKFSFKAVDQQGIDADSILVCFKTSEGEYLSVSSETEYAYDEATGLVNCSHVIEDYETEGRYYAFEIYVCDIYGFYSDYYGSSYKAAQTLFPGRFEIIHDNSEITEVSLTQKGKTLKPDDKLNLSFKADVQDVRFISVYYTSDMGDSIEMSYNAYMQTGNTISFDSATKKASGELQITDSISNGDYYLSYIYISYGDSKTAEMYLQEEDGYTFTVAEAGAPWISDFRNETAGKAFSAEDELPVSFTVNPAYTAEYIQVNFLGTGGSATTRLIYTEGAEDNQLDYDPGTGRVGLTKLVGQLFAKGQYYLSNIQVRYRYGGRIYSRYYPISDAYNQKFFVRSSTEGPVLSVTSAEDGKTLTDNQTVHYSIELAEGKNVSAVSLRMSLAEVNDSSASNNSSATIGHNIFKSLIAEKNAETGLWEASYTFTENDVYGSYILDSLRIDFEDGSFYKAESYYLNQMVLFEDSASKSLNRLEPATNLQWRESDAWCEFSLPENHQGKVSFVIYNADTGTRVRNMTTTLKTKTARKCQWDQLCYVNQLISGNYYYTVTMLGDGVSCQDSVTAVSPVFEYELPEQEAPLVSESYWDKENGKIVVKKPTGAENCYVRVNIYYSDDLNEEPLNYGYTTTSWKDGEQSAEVELWDSLISNCGDCYYYFTTQVLPYNVLELAPGETSDLSEAYKLSSKSGEVEKKIDAIDPEGEPADIRAAVQAIGTSDLKTAMLASDSVQEKLEALEDAVGVTRGVSVEEGVTGLDADGIRMLGAALNQVSSGATKVTLKIAKPKAEHILPAEYDNTLAIKISMDILNVENTSNLAVPVMITIPVPEGIQSSYLRIVHYPSSGETEYMTPTIFTGADGRDYAQFIVTGFSDFILVPEKEKVEVSFDMQGHGTQIESVMVATGSTVTKPTNPTASGYTFGGWFTDAACAAKDAWDFVNDIVKDTMTLFAKWTKRSSGGGSGSGSASTITVIKPDPAVTPITLAADGSQLLGTSVISKPISKLTAEEKASLVENGSWSKDAYGRWSLKNAAGTQMKGTWALVSDAICSRSIGNATWYYFDANGYMVTGWVWIPAADGNKYCYYFNKEDGSMYGGCLLGGTTKDGCNLDSRGRWINAVGVPETK